MKRLIIHVLCFCTITAGALMVMPIMAFASIAIPPTLTAVDDDWEIEVDPFSSDGMYTWKSSAMNNSMDQQWFWYRIDDDEFETSVDNLEFINAYQPQQNQIALSYGGLSDSIAVDIGYTLNGISPTSSIINEQVTVTNKSGSQINLSWFEYTDLDINGSINDQGAFPQSSGTSIVQIDEDGVTNTDVRVIAGDLPNRWEIAQYSDIVDSLGDNTPTTLANALTSGSGADDYTHAFEWDITLLAGESLEYTKQKEATVGGFTGNDPDNPLIPIEGPPWEFDPVPTIPGIPWWFDPVVAIGYDYTVTGNTFDQIELPVLPFGDNLYDLTWSGGGATNVAGGSFFDILDTGLTSLSVTGIEVENALDPNNPLAFVTGFMFEASGFATLSMIPITADTGTPVPEPSTFILISAGLFGLGVIGRRRKHLKTKK